MSFSDDLNDWNWPRILRLAEGLDEGSGLDPRVYSQLLEAARRIMVTRDLASLTGIAHLVYGWMPTMLDIDYEGFDATAVWRDIEMGSLDYVFFERIKQFANNSMVGASKLLHFCNPERYPMWDSRVYQCLANTRGYDYRVNNVANYITYAMCIRGLAADGQALMNLRAILCRKGLLLGGESDLRTIEYCLWLLGRM